MIYKKMYKDMERKVRALYEFVRSRRDDNYGENPALSTEDWLIAKEIGKILEP